MLNFTQAKELVILGSGGFAREVLSWLSPNNQNIVFFSENPNEKTIKNYSIALDLNHLKGNRFLSAVGNPQLRERLWHLAFNHGLYCDGFLVHKDCTFGDNVLAAPGTIICPGVRATCDITIGRSVILNLNVTVGHDTVIEDFVTISPGALISGNCKIKNNAYIGTGASIREGITIGANSIIGMGAAVICDVPANEVWGGVPAKFIRKVNV